MAQGSTGSTKSPRGVLLVTMWKIVHDFRQFLDCHILITILSDISNKRLGVIEFGLEKLGTGDENTLSSFLEGGG